MLPGFHTSRTASLIRNPQDQDIPLPAPACRLLADGACCDADQWAVDTKLSMSGWAIAGARRSLPDLPRLPQWSAPFSKCLSTDAKPAAEIQSTDS